MAARVAAGEPGVASPSTGPRGRKAPGHEFAGFDLGRPLAKSGDTGGGLAAHHRGEGLAAAGEWHVVDEGGVDAKFLGHQRDQQVIGAAGRAAAPTDRGWVGREVGEQVVQGLVWGIRRHHDHLELAGQSAIGVTDSSVTGDSLRPMPPIMTRPMTISSSRRRRAR